MCILAYELTTHGSIFFSYLLQWTKTNVYNVILYNFSVMWHTCEKYTSHRKYHVQYAVKYSSAKTGCEVIFDVMTVRRIHVIFRFWYFLNWNKQGCYYLCLSGAPMTTFGSQSWGSEEKMLNKLWGILENWHSCIKKLVPIWPLGAT